MSFVDDLNAAVRMVGLLPRVTFRVNNDRAQYWLAKKHAGCVVHEPATVAAFMAAKLRFNSQCIFDIGALHGYFALLADQLFDGARVIAFDSHPYGCAVLRQNLPRRIPVVHAAISDDSRRAVKLWLSGFNMYEEPEGGWETLDKVPGAMKQRGPNNEGRGWGTVDFITLDRFCEVLCEEPDLIKLDVEGYQAKAILGGLETFKRLRPVIITELHDPEKLERFGTTNAKTVQPLFDLGYQGFWCGNHRDAEATFEAVEQMEARHEKLSIMVFIP